MPRLSSLRIFSMMLFYFYATIVSATEIKQVQVDLHDHYYQLSADIDYQLTSQAKEALENGVPLFWNLHIKVLQQRDYWWAKKLLDIKVRYRLQYHALLNMYRVVIVLADNPLLSSEQMRTTSYNFSTLSAALDLMASLHKLPLLETGIIKADKQYVIEMKADFDRGALPLPLQSIAYVNPQWYLSSDWTLWALKK
jgi:hypothetical protein